MVLVYSCDATYFLVLVYHRYFENYKNEGEFLDLDLLDHLGDTILMNERLMFLGELKMYHTLLVQGGSHYFCKIILI